MMQPVPVTVFILLAVLADMLVWHLFLRSSACPARYAHFIPTALLMAAVALHVAHIGANVPMRAFYIILISAEFPKVAFALCAAMLRRFVLSHPSIWKYGKTAALAVAAVLAAAGIYGCFEGWRTLRTERIELRFSRLPKSFDGLRIVQVSDLHIGTFLWDRKCVDRIVDEVNSLDADIILFTGDLVNSDPAEIMPFKEILSGLRSRDGVYSIMGNHDYCIHGRRPQGTGSSQLSQIVISTEKEMGWDILLNESRIIRHGNDSICLIGVENDSRPPFPQRADLPKAMRGVRTDMFKIIMTHDPTHWRRAILPDTDCDLTLSGHTHAAQLRIGGFSPARLTYGEWGGMYEENGRVLYVSTGVGSNIPFRLGAWPEIELITLRSGE